jgi:tetratricopeptide (TPR) repeat protein
MSAGNESDRPPVPSISSRWLLSPALLRLGLLVLAPAGGLVGGFIFFLYFTPLWWPPFAFVGGSLAILGLVTGVAIVWYKYLAYGELTWMRAANKPLLELQRGNPDAAERAYAIGVERARRFSADDRRRALMLCQLAKFARLTGRYAEALALFDESAVILGRTTRRTDPNQVLQHVNALMMYGHCRWELRDFAGTLRVLDKIADLVFVAGRTDELTFLSSLKNQFESLQVLLSINLAAVFIEMHDLEQARRHLVRAAEQLLRLPPDFRTYESAYRCRLALLEALSGNVDAARSELAKISLSDDPMARYVSAKVDLASKNYAGAETLLREYHEHEARSGTLHRPVFLESTLDLAEAQFGQGKHEEAFATFAEARSIVADFPLPADKVWREAVAVWLQRAREAGKVDLAASLSELAPAATPAQAVTVLGNIRAQTE